MSSISGLDAKERESAATSLSSVTREPHQAPPFKLFTHRRVVILVIAIAATFLFPAGAAPLLGSVGSEVITALVIKGLRGYNLQFLQQIEILTREFDKQHPAAKVVVLIAAVGISPIAPNLGIVMGCGIGIYDAFVIR